MEDFIRRRFDIGAGIVARLVLVGLLAVLLGCPQTNQDLYEESEVGEATLKNASRKISMWLGGCNAFEQQRLQDGQWISQGGDIPCLWEGLASRLAPGEARVDPFTARDAGTWRLVYPVGFGCRADQPLHRVHCDRVTNFASNEFEVVIPPGEDEFLCTDSGGFWDQGSCGDYVCGSPPICTAAIPGCDCGANANFVPGEGCVDDATCGDIGNPGGEGGARQALCEDTSGRWDPLSCGDYSCGTRPDCTAIIAGCDCGPTGVFDEVFGCLDVPCGAPQD